MNAKNAFFFLSTSERSEGEGKGKKEEDKGERERRKEKGEREREIGGEALAETEKIAHAPARNRTRDPSKRGRGSGFDSWLASWQFFSVSAKASLLISLSPFSFPFLLSLPLPFPFPLPPTFHFSDEIFKPCSGELTWKGMVTRCWCCYYSPPLCLGVLTLSRPGCVCVGGGGGGLKNALSYRFETFWQLIQDPLEASLVIFGPRALTFCMKALGKIWKMTPLLCACAVVITLETQKCRKRHLVSSNLTL